MPADWHSTGRFRLALQTSWKGTPLLRLAKGIGPSRRDWIPGEPASSSRASDLGAGCRPELSGMGMGRNRTARVLKGPVSLPPLSVFLTCCVPTRGPCPNPRRSGAQERAKPLQPFMPGLHFPPHGGSGTIWSPENWEVAGRVCPSLPEEVLEVGGASDTGISRASCPPQAPANSRAALSPSVHLKALARLGTVPQCLV